MQTEYFHAVYFSACPHTLFISETFWKYFLFPLICIFLNVVSDLSPLLGLFLQSKDPCSQTALVSFWSSVD